MSFERERLVELATQIGRRLDGAIKEVIPPEVQRHLLAAQRELLTAAFLMYEHRVGRGGPPASAPRRRRRGYQRIDVE